MIPALHFPFPVIYCRHGQTDWNKEDRLQGHADIPLNNKGEEQARAYGRALRAMDLDWSKITLFSSPLSRAQRTLELILEELDVTKTFQCDDRLIELNLGDWCGKRIPDVARNYPEEWAARRKDPWAAKVPGNGEGYKDAEPRIRAFAKTLTGPSLIVGHGGTGRVFRGLLTNGDPKEFLKEGTRQDRVYVLQEGHEKTYPSIEEN